MSSTDKPLTLYQQSILRHAKIVALRHPTFTTDDIADRLDAVGSGVSKTSALETALNYLAAVGRLIRLREGVFRVATDVLIAKAANG